MAMINKTDGVTLKLTRGFDRTDARLSFCFCAPSLVKGYLEKFPRRVQGSKLSVCFKGVIQHSCKGLRVIFALSNVILNEALKRQHPTE
jgi:hypothetical protein